MTLESTYRRAPIWAQNAMLNAYALKIEWHRYGRRVGVILDRLKEMERWPRERLQAYQDERLRRIVQVAYAGSAYYRQLFDENGLRPADIRTAADLRRLPLLTKEIIRARGPELLNGGRPMRGWLHGHTSGTTGSPLSLWYDRETAIFNNAVDLRQKAWGGMTRKDWIGLFLGRVLVPPPQQRPPFWRVNGVQRQVWFSSFHMTDENLEVYAEEVRRRGLRFLEGYPSTLYILAKHLTRTGSKLPMQAVFSSSETLHALQRETIEAAFGCPIFDFFGHAERTVFAAECQAHAGKHLAEEYGVVEVVDENDQPVPEGSRGYLVGTSLHNTALPMLRYRTGDVSAIVTEPCSCGRTLHRMEDVSTKAEDIIVTPDGRMISPSILTHPFKPYDQILKSQVIQERLNLVRIKLVPSAEFTAEQETGLIEGLRQRLGAGVEIKVEVVDDIPREPSGKFRWVISRVEHACRFGWEGARQDPPTSP